MKTTKLIIFLSILSSCAHFDIQTRPIITNIFVQEFPSRDNITQGLSIVMNELAREGLLTHKQMSSIINNKKMARHRNCKSKSHQLRIIFTPGVWSEENNDYCIYSSLDGLQDKCFLGLFNGGHTIYIISRGIKLHNTSFAHELFHYFQAYAGDPLHPKHEPKKLWLDLFGYQNKNRLGRINKALKKQGL